MSAVSPMPLPPSLLRELADETGFVIYRLADKVPVDPAKLHAINAQDSANWLTAKVARAYAKLRGAEYGVGIVLHPGRKIFCIDIDKAWDGSAWSPLAGEFCTRFAGAYQEVSPGKHGIHIFASYTGELPPHRKKNTALHIEFYDELRFVGISEFSAQGSVLFDATRLVPALIAEYFPPAAESDSSGWTTEPAATWAGPEDDDELIRRMLASRPGAASIFGDKASIKDLWNGDVDALARAFPAQSPGKAYDASSADQSLFNSLAFWCGSNCERMRRVGLRSALYRDKWNRDDYLNGTILNAASWQKTHYKQQRSEAPPAPVVADGTAKPDKKVIPPPPAPTTEDPRPVILLTAGKLDQYAIQAEQLIADSIYVRGGGLVRIGQAAELSTERVVDASGRELAVDPAGTRRELAQAVCIVATAGWLRRELMSRARFAKYDKRSNEWELRDCPRELAENIGDQGSWSTFRSLITIASVPFLRSDLSVCEVPGYDPATGIYYQPTVAFPPILSHPTQADAVQALNRLYDPFSEFPFATVEGRSAFLAHVLTAILRPSFDTSPVFFYTAPQAATGKSYLASMPGRIAHGTPSAKSPYTEKDELKKVLFSSLLAGDAELIFDNVPNGSNIRSPHLCGFVTEPSWSDRVLGISEMRKIPNRSTVAMTGNNITPAGDMSRRSLVIRLDSNMESARGRKFRIKDLVAHVRALRPQLIVDALTIVRAYGLAGRPVDALPLESFVKWSEVVRDPLMWLGMPDAVASQVGETEDEAAPLRAAFEAIAAAVAHLGHPFTAGELADLMVLPAFPTLRPALIDADCAEPADPTKLGYWLRDRRDRVGGMLKLVRYGAKQWQLKPV
jgi:hypothetical protein